MRTILTALGLAALLTLLTGCPPQKGFIRPTGDVRPPREAPPPTQEVLLQNLNDNAQRLRSVESNIDIQADAGGQMIPLRGNMSAQQPQNFRLMARALGQPAVDMGSNQQEFWYWLKNPGEPMPLVYCSYADLTAGKARMPFPFQPEWIIETLGMKERDPKATYQVDVKDRTVDLVEQTTSPQGQPLRKVTVFNKTPLRDGRYQVTAHFLQDAKGQTICSAEIKDVHQDQGGGLLPKRVVLSWPAEKMRLDLVLERPVVNGQIDQNRSAVLFTKPQIGSRSVDLARLSAQPMGYVQQASGGYTYGPPQYQR